MNMQTMAAGAMLTAGLLCGCEKDEPATPPATPPTTPQPAPTASKDITITVPTADDVKRTAQNVKEEVKEAAKDATEAVKAGAQKAGETVSDAAARGLNATTRKAGEVVTTRPSS